MFRELTVLLIALVVAMAVNLGAWPRHTPPCLKGSVEAQYTPCEVRR